MNAEIYGNIIFLCGAGVSAEAGIFTSDKITDILINYGSYCPSKNSTFIENLLRYIQVRIADFYQVKASEINFEYLLGTLIELSKKEEYPTIPFLGEGDLLIKKIEGSISLPDIVDSLNALLRECFFVKDSLSYLNPLNSFLDLARPLSFFTLNYDLSIETVLSSLSMSYTTGYRKRGVEEFPIWDPSEFEQNPVDARIFKLHGSINWGQYYQHQPPMMGSENSSSEWSKTEAYLANYPERVEFDPFRIGSVEPPDRTMGMVSLMNFGIRKELLYAESQFTVLFNHFLNALKTARICIVAGYSFRDKRINKILEEAMVSRGGNLHLIIVDPQAYWLLQKNPILSKFIDLEWATTIDKTIGKALNDESLKESTKKTLETTSLPHECLQDSSIDEHGEPDEGKPDAKNILAAWKTLGIDFDLTYFWLRSLAMDLEKLEHCVNESDALEIGRLLLPLNRKVRDLCYDLWWVYKAMHLDGAYGEKYLNNINARPKLTSKSPQIALVRKWLPELGTAVSWVFHSYNRSTAEFRQAVTDQNYGKSFDAPSNIQAAELIIGHDVTGRLYELVCILNDIYKGAGYEEPFAMIAKEYCKSRN
ncbi:MAG: hypothetical protein ACLP29_08840 [Dissulfurispiraceae bacterium]